MTQLSIEEILAKYQESIDEINRLKDELANAEREDNKPNILLFRIMTFTASDNLKYYENEALKLGYRIERRKVR